MIGGSALTHRNLRPTRREAVTSFLRLRPVSVPSPRCLPCTLAVSGQCEGSLSSELIQVAVTDARIGWLRTVSATPSANSAWTLRSAGSGCSKSGRILTLTPYDTPIVDSHAVGQCLNPHNGEPDQDEAPERG